MPNNEIPTSDISPMSRAMLEEGALKAFQSVAQSSAIAIQDAVDNLRNINTISATAIGVAMAQMLANPAEMDQYASIVASAQRMAAEAAANFASISNNATAVLKQFPAGS